MGQKTEEYPRWAIDEIYSGFDSAEYKAALELWKTQNQALEAFLDSLPREFSSAADCGAALEKGVELNEKLDDCVGSLRSYIYCRFAEDSRDSQASLELSKMDSLSAKSASLGARFESWVGALGDQFEAAVEQSSKLKDYAFSLRHAFKQSQYRMDSDLEVLAAELSIDGAKAFSNLQSSITSQLQVDFELDGKTESMSIATVKNLSSHADRDLRERAHHAEVKGWSTIATPVAACLNAIKGQANTLAIRRGRKNVLESAIDQNFIDQQTLDAMMGAIEDFFPVFRRYLKSKAKKLGLDQLCWWDLFAPIGGDQKSYSWDEAKSFIVDKFGSFSKEMADFASSAFDSQWIDASPREGKSNGAFCIPFPAQEQSRILANFDGSLDQVFTLAHELGHGYHNECQRGLSSLLRGTPSSLAETASIFCETLVSTATLKTADEAERLAILEAQLCGATQVCLDISSRFRFESAVLERKFEGSMSADELCEMFNQAQAETYGDSVKPETYHPYMWLWKPHYYSANSHFYNFPYAFGQLFSLGLYAVYQKEGDSFIDRYKQLLRTTGQNYAVELAAEFGLNLHEREFWASSLGIFKSQVEQYENL